MPLPLVLIHGYSDKGASFQIWREKLTTGQSPLPQETISTCSYESLTDEVTIKDLADGLDRALDAKLGNGNPAFDAIVHSTGMLVIREWLIRDPDNRKKRLKHLVALAPATFGSPLARQGRSWLGAVFKGQRHLGPDFLSSGDAILDGLELASPYTRDLANRDIFQKFFDNEPNTPYVFVFCGTEAYGGIRQLANTPGMDGTVRWAGAGLNTRRIIVDLTHTTPDDKRFVIDDWMAINVPVHLMSSMNHGTILSNPTDEIVTLVKNALEVGNADQFKQWLVGANAYEKATAVRNDPEKGAWQQVIVRCVDQRGDPISDFHIQLFEGDEPVPEFDDQRVEVYSHDGSYRCFHFDVGKLLERQSLTIKIMALSGSTWIDFQGFGWEQKCKTHPLTNRERAMGCHLQSDEILNK
jgi:hypothetical protein